MQLPGFPGFSTLTADNALSAEYESLIGYTDRDVLDVEAPLMPMLY